MIKLVMQYRATIIEEILDVTQQPIILFTPLLANKALIYNHIVPQTLILIKYYVCFYFSLLAIMSLYYRYNNMGDVMFLRWSMISHFHWIEFCVRVSYLMSLH